MKKHNCFGVKNRYASDIRMSELSGNSLITSLSKIRRLMRNWSENRVTRNETWKTLREREGGRTP